MINLKTERRQKLGKLFTGTRIDGCMLNAILDGHIGEAFTDAENPTYGILELTEAKVAFIGGNEYENCGRWDALITNMITTFSIDAVVT